MAKNNFEGQQSLMTLPQGGTTNSPFALSPLYFQQMPAGAGGGMEPESDEQKVPLSHYLWIVRRHSWKILAWVLLCMLGTFLVSSRLAPIYESTATIDVDRQAPSAIVGQDAARALSPNDADQFLATQVRLIQSDSVLRPIADKYRLLDHEEQTKDLTEGKLRALLAAPVALRKLTVVRPPNTYLLQVSYRSTDPALAADGTQRRRRVAVHFRTGGHAATDLRVARTRSVHSRRTTWSRQCSRRLRASPLCSAHNSY